MPSFHDSVKIRIAKLLQNLQMRLLENCSEDCSTERCLPDTDKWQHPFLVQEPPFPCPLTPVQQAFASTEERPSLAYWHTYRDECDLPGTETIRHRIVQHTDAIRLPPMPPSNYPKEKKREF